MLEITGDNFENEILKSEKPVVVDFWAEWCFPCKAMAPEFEALSKEMGNVKFAKLDVDNNQELSMKFGVMSIPTMIMFKGGKEAARTVGSRGRADIKKWIESKI